MELTLGRSALLLLVGLGLGCARGPGGGGRAEARPPFDPGPVPEEHAAGAQLFLASCTGCHGPAGSGFRGGPPLLDTLYLPASFPDSAVRRAVLAGAPSRNWDFDDMPAVRTVRPDQVPLLVGYIRWVQRRWTAGVAPPVGHPPAPADAAHSAESAVGSAPAPGDAGTTPSHRAD